MLRQTLIFSGLVILGVTGITMTGGEISPMTRVLEWASTPTIPDTPYVAVATQNAQPSAREVSLDAMSNGHFFGEFRINGRRVNAMVDTGATVIAMNQTMARSAGIKLSASDFNKQVQTANGRTKAAAAMLDRVQIGRIEVQNVEAMILEDANFDGVLVGMSFLRRLQRFEAKDNRLLLVQ